MVSVGVLYDAQKLLNKIQGTPLSASLLLESFPRLEVAEFSVVLKLCQECQWLAVNHNNHLIISPRGAALCSHAEAELALRAQIVDLLSLTAPSWARKIADGRAEAVKIMSEEVRQIFREAGLLADWTDELIGWWDAIGLAARHRKSEKNLETGRRAERLSLDYEETRTGRRPEWTCANTNYAGYDLLSILGRDDSRPQPIEVKGSTQRLTEATFSLSRNEWDVANGNGSYRLHLWLVKPRDQEVARDLRVVSSDRLGAHIPADAGSGEWSTVRIPFRAFWSQAECSPSTC
jgi:hypothetical protein